MNNRFMGLCVILILLQIVSCREWEAEWQGKHWGKEWKKDWMKEWRK